MICRSVVPILPRAQSPRALLEVRVMHGLLGADAASRVVDEHALEEVEAVLAEDLDTVRVDDLVVLLPLPLRKATLEVREGSDAGPVGLGRSAEDAEDLEDLVDFGVTGEERLARGHLGEDAANGPHVDAGGVLATTEENFRGAVPESDDFVGVGAKRHTESASETEISQLEVALLVDEQVLWLQVTVQNAVGVAVAGALQQLQSELLDLHNWSACVPSCSYATSQYPTYHLRAQAHVSLTSVHGTLGQRLSAPTLTNRQSLHVLLQIQVEVFEDKVELVTVGVDNVIEPHNVRVVHFLEEGNLANGGGRDTLILGLEADLLERDNALLWRGEIEGLVDDTVRACKKGGVSVLFPACLFLF